MTGNPPSEMKSSGRSSIIDSVRTPLGLLALALLAVEAILAILAANATPPDTTYLIGAMVAVILLVVLLVVALAIWRPEALAGLRPGGVAAASDKPMSPPPTTVDEVATSASVDSDLIDPKLVRFIPPLHPTQFKIVNLPRPFSPKFFDYPFTPSGKLPIFGIPFFLLPVVDSSGAMRGHNVIDLQPSKTNEAHSQRVDATVSNAKAVHMLMSAGHGWRMHEQVQFLNRRVGYIRLSFSQGPDQLFNLILGKHLREWAFGNNTNLVTEIDLGVARPAWLSHDSTKRFDLLAIPIESPPRDLEAIEVVAEFENDHPGKLIDTPSIIISAITVERVLGAS